ncbi:MAG TPA: metalloregulator ArsR/SmtB family transcription factor [Euzebya sp.]|nr:metalloregulator ArsR/SmtB family transcription factor [Euzebya sp.]
MGPPVYELKAGFFRTLGHPARIRILEVLREGSSTVGDLAEAVGVSGSTLSQHLAALRNANVITSERDGSFVRYEVVDPRLFHLMECARQILTSTLHDSQEVLGDLERMRFGTSE